MYDVSTVCRQLRDGVYRCYECRHGWCGARYSVDSVWVVCEAKYGVSTLCMRCQQCVDSCGMVYTGVTNVDMGGVVLDTVSTVFGWCARPSRGCRHYV